MNKINKKILVLDNGHYTYVAKELAKYFEKVYYFSRWACGFPSIAAQKNGDGVEGVEKVLSWEEVIKEVDIAYFTDIYFRETANYIKDMGKMVWGSCNMESLERDRGLFLSTISDAGLPTPETKEIKGIDRLRDYLSDKKDTLWIKISEYRGIKETWKFVDPRFVEGLLVEIEGLLGIYKNDILFYVQKPIGNLEYGIDPIVSNCVLSTNMPFGIEVKDKIYFMKFEDFDNLPEGIKEVNLKFLQQVEGTDAREYVGHLSSEIRIDKDKNYFTDLTPRNPSPASASTFYGCSNWGEVVISALTNQPITFKPKYKYVIEILVKSDIKDKYNPIYFDDKYKDQIFLQMCSVQDGYTYTPPENQMIDAFGFRDDDVYIGSVCGGGSTIKEAIESAKEALDNMEGFRLKYEIPTEEEVMESIELIYEETGYKF